MAETVRVGRTLGLRDPAESPRVPVPANRVPSSPLFGLFPMHNIPHFDRITRETATDGTEYVYYWNNDLAAPVHTEVIRPALGNVTPIQTLRDVMHETGETDPYRADHIRRGGHW